MRSSSALRRVVGTRAPAATILIRFAVGAVFLSEGIQKLLDPSRGSGRFAKIGLPSPETLGPFVGGLETFCGALILLGLLTRLAAIPLLPVMGVALWTTKLPILLNDGFWEAAHEARTDWAMALGAAYLLAVGAGRLSLDAWLTRKAGSGERDGSDE